MQLSITVTILSMTASSPEELVASNLQFETTVLNSAKAALRFGDAGDIMPETNRLWSADKAAEVMGPVDNGERIIAKNGERIVGSGTVNISENS
jgi:hypothetical protein